MHDRNLARRVSRALIVLILALGGVGCASTGGYTDPRDPLEGFNRVVYDFNEVFDRALLKPVAQGYQKVMPAPVDKGVTNFFANLRDVNAAINNTLQFKLERGGISAARFLVNSTVGVLGLFDVASNLDLHKYEEDFGQTFGYWGIGPGPYIVLPFLGPSSGRDTIGMFGDWYANPIAYLDSSTAQWGLIALRLVDHRADLLGASRVLEQAALDPYEFTRDAFLQKRLYDIYDGNPPDDI